jgi:hypothetical protein
MVTMKWEEGAHRAYCLKAKWQHQSVQTSFFFSLLADSNQFKQKAAEEFIAIALKYVAQLVDMSSIHLKLVDMSSIPLNYASMMVVL